MPVLTKELAIEGVPVNYAWRPTPQGDNQLVLYRGFWETEDVLERLFKDKEAEEKGREVAEVLEEGWKKIESVFTDGAFIRSYARVSSNPEILNRIWFILESNDPYIFFRGSKLANHLPEIAAGENLHLLAPNLSSEIMLVKNQPYIKVGPGRLRSLINLEQSLGKLVRGLYNEAGLPSLVAPVTAVRVKIADLAIRDGYGYRDKDGFVVETEPLR